MRKLVATPPATFTAANTAAFTALGVKTATFGAGRVSQKGSKAQARVTESYALPRVGAWRTATTVHLVQRNGIWKVAWTPATINPALQGTDTPGHHQGLADPRRHHRSRRRAAHRRPAPGRRRRRRQPDQERQGGGRRPHRRRRHPRRRSRRRWPRPRPTRRSSSRCFRSRRRALSSSRPSPAPTTSTPSPAPSSSRPPPAAPSRRSSPRTSIGTVGPITAEQLKTLGPPYDASSQVGQTGLEYAAERRLAGTPTTKVIVETAGGALVKTLASFPGRPGHAAEHQPRPQRPARRRGGAGRRAQERGHGGDARLHRSGAGRGLRPGLGGLQPALQGAYPPGSTFKVLTSAALIQKGLSPDVGGNAARRASPWTARCSTTPRATSR